MELGDRTHPVELWQQSKVGRVDGQGKSRRYASIRAGIYPPPVKCGASSRWISSEVEAMRDFTIAHPRATDDERRAFVVELIAKRPTVPQTLAA